MTLSHGEPRSRVASASSVTSTTARTKEGDDVGQLIDMRVKDVGRRVSRGEYVVDPDVVATAIVQRLVARTAGRREGDSAVSSGPRPATVAALPGPQAS